MRHLQTSAAGLLILITFSCSVAKAQQNNAVLYMEKINREMNAIMIDSWDYTSEVAHGKSARKAEAKRRNLVITSKLAMNRVSNMGEFNGSTQFRDSVVEFLRINYLVLKEDYDKIVNMEDIAEQSYDLMEAYLLAKELAGEKLDSASDRMQEQQKIFAAANNINLVENKDKMAKKMEKAGDVIKHYNAVYLIFFKSYKQEAYMMDAISKKDVGAMEQNKNALAATSSDGLARLNSVVQYKNDRSMIFAAKNALDFYQAEASTKMGNIIDFYIWKENFEKIRSALEAKPKQDRTNEDITQYNDAVNEFNKRLNILNKLYKDLNADRERVLDNWDRTAKHFMDSHIPKYKP
jgi:hypothetical protein